MASTKIKARFPLLLLLGILFLASVSVCYGIVSHDKEDDERRPWWPEPEREEERHHQRPRGSEEGEKEERERHKEPGQRERGHRERARQEGEKEEDERQPWWQPGRGEEEGEWRGSRRLEDPDERERVRERTERAKKWRREIEERDTPRRPHHRESEEEEGSSSSESSRRSQRKNPFHFRSSRFHTRFQNENGHLRVLQRFDERSKLFENLQNYRILEFKAKPHTLVLPHHNDVDSIIVVLSGKAIVTIVNPNDRESYNLERGDALVHPAGTTAYIANRDDDENLRVVKLIIPINRPGQFQSFFPSSTESQESYLNGFSRNILEAAFNAEYDEIERVLLRGEQRGEQRQEQGLIVKVSRDQIQQLSRPAKSSSRKRTSSESEPFNLRSRDPIYSNEFGKHFEINPNRNPQLRDLDIFLGSTEIKEGSIFLPHYNSRSTVILVINEGRGELELVAQRRQQQQRRNEEEEEEEEEEEQPRIEAQRFRAKLSPGDVVVIPAGHPVAVKASSDLNFIAFGINAENNQRNFLAGGDDNVISQIQRPVKELAFPGSAEDVEKLIKNQRNSYFANAQPQQREEGGHGRRGPLSSILGAFY